jgi:transposase
MKSPNRDPVGTNPRGKPKNGNGGIRKIPEKVDRKVKVKFSEEELKSLKKKHGEKLKIKTVKLHVWDLPAIKLIVTQFIVQRAYVGKQLVAQAVHSELPKGIFGNRLRSWIISLKNGFAGSYERIREHIEDVTNESFSAQALKDCIHRTGKELEPSYKELESELREAKVAGSDETGWKINGVLYYLWLICTINIVFITIEKSRGRNVMIKIFGKEFEGVIISDCWVVYQGFAKYFQKCWAHLLRRTHYLAEQYPKRDIVKLHRWLTSLFNEMSNFLEKDPPLELREKKYGLFNRKLKKIRNYPWKSEEAKGIVKNWLMKYSNDWLTAIEIPGVKLTNNDTEREIRSVIPTRKLLGGHRTEEGAKYYAITQSLRLTWKRQGYSPFHNMTEKLSEINCMN